MSLPAFVRRGARPNSFTLIELLVVIAVITILAALTMAAAEAVINKGARSRALAEIQSLSTGLESYKADNGVYPWTNIAGQVSFGSTNDYATVDASSQGGFYMVSAQVLYEALSGKTNFEDTPVASVKTYTSFKATQVGNLSTTAGSGYSTTAATYVQDSWGYPYGYYTSSNTATPPYNGANMFDLWSTGGLLKSTSATTPGWTNTWVSNWSVQ